MGKFHRRSQSVFIRSLRKSIVPPIPYPFYQDMVRRGQIKPQILKFTFHQRDITDCFGKQAVRLPISFSYLAFHTPAAVHERKNAWEIPPYNPIKFWPSRIIPLLIPSPLPMRRPALRHCRNVLDAARIRSPSLSYGSIGSTEQDIFLPDLRIRPDEPSI